MRKVSLELNLGKKSQARFPKRFPSNLKLKILAPASQASVAPPLGPAITIFGVVAKEFCEEFNHFSRDYDPGFLVSVNIFLTKTKTHFYEFVSPTCFNLFHRCFDFYEGNDLLLNKKTILLFCLNIALIKNVDNEQGILLTNLTSRIKQVLGSLRSYGFVSKKKNKKKLTNIFFRKRFDIYNTKFTRKKI